MIQQVSFFLSFFFNILEMIIFTSTIFSKHCCQQFHHLEMSKISHRAGLSQIIPHMFKQQQDGKVSEDGSFWWLFVVVVVVFEMESRSVAQAGVQ